MRHEALIFQRRSHDTTDFRIEHERAMNEFRNSRDIHDVSPEWRELLNQYILTIADSGMTVGGGCITRKVMASF